MTKQEAEHWVKIIGPHMAQVKEYGPVDFCVQLTDRVSERFSHVLLTTRDCFRFAVREIVREEVAYMKDEGLVHGSD